MIATELDLTADMLDVRDIIARFEELRDERDQSDLDPSEYGGPNDDWKDERAELASLEQILDELKGCGGDEQWEGDWYPVTLINESYFESAMNELLEDIGDIPKDLPCYLKIVVDYDALRSDYTAIEIDDTTYFYR